MSDGKKDKRSPGGLTAQQITEFTILRDSRAFKAVMERASRQNMDMFRLAYNSKTYELGKEDYLKAKGADELLQKMAMGLAISCNEPMPKKEPGDNK